VFRNLSERFDLHFEQFAMFCGTEKHMRKMRRDGSNRIRKVLACPKRMNRVRIDVCFGKGNSGFISSFHFKFPIFPGESSGNRNGREWE